MVRGTGHLVKVAWWSGPLLGWRGLAFAVAFLHSVIAFAPLPPERLMRSVLPLLALTLLVVGGCSRRAGREPGLTGRWIVTRSELADSGVLVPSILMFVARVQHP
jgi:apolipoprotein N-acyltransferase